MADGRVRRIIGQVAGGMVPQMVSDKSTPFMDIHFVLIPTLSIVSMSIVSMAVLLHSMSGMRRRKMDALDALFVAHESVRAIQC